MSNIVLSQLDDKFLFALNEKEINPIAVNVKESYSVKGKKLFVVLIDSTIMDYEIKAIEEQGFRHVWTATFKQFDDLKCLLEVAFREQE